MDIVRYVRNQWDRICAWLCVIGGAAALLIGYLGVSGTDDSGKQLPYVVSGGLAGIFLLGLGALLWLSADLRDEWRKLDAVDRYLMSSGSLPDASPTLGGSSSSAEPAPELAGRVVPEEVSLR